MTNRKNLCVLAALTLTSGLVALPVYAQIPVTVTSDLPAMANQSATMAKWVEQLIAMREQYQKLSQQYAAITGHYERGAIGLVESVKSAGVVPGSWQDVVAMQKSGAFRSIQNDVEQLMGTIPKEMFRDPAGRSATDYKLSTDAVRAALAGGQALYAQVQTNLNNLLTMAGNIDQTANAKDAQDLQNRIAAENGVLQSALAKMSMMNLNLQASMLNEQNQAAAINQQRYQPAAP